MPELIGIPYLKCPKCSKDAIFIINGVVGKCYIKSAGQKGTNASMEVIDAIPTALMFCFDCFYKFSQHDIENAVKEHSAKN
jgi:hypothetical protein